MEKTKSKRSGSKKLTLVSALVVVYFLVLIVGASYAYIKENTPSITNLFSTGLRFELIYNANGGTGSMDPDVFQAAAGTTSHEFTVKAGTGLAREGYTFLGWSTSASATAAEYIPGDAEHGSITLGLLNSRETLYAVWQKDVTVVLSYDTQGGTPEIASQSYALATTENSHSFQVTATEPSQEGYTFKGWSETAGGEATLHAGDGVTLTRDNPEKTIYAVWEQNISFTLSYDLNGGTADPAIGPDTWTSAGTVESHDFAISSSVPVREDYDFIGWADTSDATEAVYSSDSSVGQTSITLPASSPTKIIYAVWELATVYNNYELIYDVNLPEDLSGADVTTPAKQTKRSEELSCTIVIDAEPAVNDFDDNGLVFLGWSTTAGGEVEYANGSSYTLTLTPGANTESVTLYAVWQRNYYVNYVSTVTNPAAYKVLRAGGTTVDNTDPIEVASANPNVSTLSLYAESTEYLKRTGYMLVGFSETDGSNQIAENLSLTQSGRDHAKTVYAIWTPGTFALLYDANGGTGAPAAQTYQEAALSHTFTINTTTIPVPHSGASDAQFLGWAYSATASTPDYVYDSTAHTMTPATITLTEDDPSCTLYAVWKYHYVLTFDRGNGNSDSPLPAALEKWTTDDSWTFSIPNGPIPTRENYRFMDFWSDTKDRENGENRYYRQGLADQGFKTTVTLSSRETKKTVYARFEPLIGYSLVFDGLGADEKTVPDAIVKSNTSDWMVVFDIPTQEPTKTDNTFLGWSESPDADYTWLDSSDPDKVIYGGRSDNWVYALNMDVDVTATLYAVWAPDRRVQISVDFNGGSGWYQTTTSQTSGCNTTYPWGGKQIVTSTSRVWSTTLTYDQYMSNPVASVTVGGSAGNNSSSHDALFQLSRQDFILRGFSFDKDNLDPEYSEEHGNLTKSATNTPKTGNGTSSGQYNSVGTYTISGVTLNTDTATPSGTYGSNGGLLYRATLYAVWKPTFVYYNIVAVDTANGNQEVTLLSKAQEPISEDGVVSSHTIAANTLLSTLTKDGWICDFAYDNGAATPDFTVASQWDYVQNGGSSGVKEPQKKDSTGKWYIEQEMVLAPGGRNITKSIDPDTTADVYTLTLYTVWEQGKVFQLTVNSDNSHGGTLVRWRFSGSTDLSDWSASRITSESIKVTVRADVTSYTWEAGKAGEFHGTLDRSGEGTGYYFIGYAYAYGEDPAYSVNTRSVSYSYKPILVTKTETQRFDSIAESVTVAQNGDHVSTSTVNGSPCYTLNLYAIWGSYKTYQVTFNANGGSFATNATKTWVSEKHYTSETEHTFPNNTFFSRPTRSGFKLIGFAYTESRANQGIVDLVITTNYLANDLTVVDTDKDDPDKSVTVSGSGPVKVTMTLYAVWQKEQVFQVTVNANASDAHYATSGSPVSSISTSTYLDDLEATSASVSIYSTMPERSGYVMLGYAYTADATEPDFVVDDDGHLTPSTVLVDKADLPRNGIDRTITNATDSNGVERTTLTLYAVWGENATYFKIKILSPDGGTETTTLSQTVTSVTTSHTFEANSSPLYVYTLANSRTGYRLAGLSYTNGGEIVYAVDGNYISDDVLVEKNGQNVEETGTDLKTYTLTMYAVWVKQNIFRVVVDANYGSFRNTANSSYTTNTYTLTQSSGTWKADVGVETVTVSGYFMTYNGTSSTSSSYVVAQRADQVYLSGVSRDRNSQTPEYAITRNSSATKPSNLSYYVHYQRINDIVIDINDPHVTVAPYESDPEIQVYTLTLYVCWEQQQHFVVSFDPNGGQYHLSTGTATDTHKAEIATVSYSATSATGSTSYTDLNDIYHVRPGYMLFGFAYTQERAAAGVIDYPTNSTGQTVTVPGITIDKENEAGKEITHTFEAKDSAQIETTTLTLYAVWGTKLEYIGGTGIGNVPAAQIRLGDAAADRVYLIAEVEPTKEQFSFLGWASAEGGVSQYGAPGYYIATVNDTLSSTYEFDAETGYQKLYPRFAQQYKLFYSPNGGDETSVPANEMSFSSASNEVFTVSSTIPTRSGHRFLGWADSPEATEPDYTFDASNGTSKYIHITGNANGASTSKTVYAVWEQTRSAGPALASAAPVDDLEDPENPDPENPDPEDPDPENPDPENPDPENPDPENQDPPVNQDPPEQATPGDAASQEEPPAPPADEPQGGGDA